jgi:pterin-4a-carbinolamine dehydratase
VLSQLWVSYASVLEHSVFLQLHFSVCFTRRVNCEYFANAINFMGFVWHTMSSWRWHPSLLTIWNVCFKLHAITISWLICDDKESKISHKSENYTLYSPVLKEEVISKTTSWHTNWDTGLAVGWHLHAYKQQNSVTCALGISSAQWLMQSGRKIVCGEDHNFPSA